ncbi:MAG TPA: DUF1697 domain-containing protein [Planctomycetaceae bacterium]|jgi:uncharacterized protein (DUF1697 family)|nr:DUF1697 domain-containing protein [Planctomycetaceae bacterium]
MSTFVALLRGINVGGHNAVAMSDLRDLVTDLGFAGATTLLQSGNVVFKATGKTSNALESLLEKETAKRLGVSADYIVRNANEWAKVVAANPFSREAREDPSHLVVVSLKTAAAEKSVNTLRASIKGRETIHGVGKHLYIVYPDGMGTSKLTGTVIERALGSRGTARNWNTVLKLLALSQKPEL